MLDETHRKKAVLTDENFEDIQNRLQISARKFVGRLSQKTGASVGFASAATKLIKFLLYKVRFVHEIKPIDATQRIRLCNWMLKNVQSGFADPQLLFINIEAYFY